VFKSFGMDDDKIDKSPFYSILYGESYSRVLKSQLDNPREFKALMIWVRILGFFFLCFGVISLGFIVTLWRSS
jgi:hypothetical protein